MKIQQLMEGVEPKMPGAPQGIQIMTPQQFVAKAGDMPGEESEEDVAEGADERKQNALWAQITAHEKAAKRTKDLKQQHHLKMADQLRSQLKTSDSEQGVAEGSPQSMGTALANALSRAEPGSKLDKKIRHHNAMVRQFGPEAGTMTSAPDGYHIDRKGFVRLGQGVAEGSLEEYGNTNKGQKMLAKVHHRAADRVTSKKADTDPAYARKAQQTQDRAYDRLKDVAEGLDRIRSLAGLGEATKLPASSREFGGDEFQDYMKRIVGTPDIDKKTGKPKVDKKGIEKYVSGKTKSDRYKMPYIHRSSVIEYLGPDGKTYDEDKIKQALAERPKKLLKQNEKMKHSNGELEQFFNVGFAALTGIALDEDTNKLIIVNTCPGAGSCKVDCFAMKGGKVQFKAAWQSDGRILTYLLNDPDGFFEQLSSEITKEEAAGKKGGYTVTIRWHDAGDFFSPEYLDLALKMAAKHPNTKFYAYTKMAGAALAKKPDNFIINWSEGAHTSQEKQVKAQDKDLETTKNSRIVPDEIFQDLLVKDAKKNLVKGPEGQWQVQPDKLPELKQRLAKQYGLSANSILSYDEYMAKRKNIPAGMKYNVIVAPGEGDISANDPNIISTLLLKH